MSREQPLSYETLLRRAAERLSEAGVAEAELDAWYLLENTFGISRAEYLWKKKEKPGDVPACWQERIERRAAREPLAYILGKTEFMGLPFFVEAGVLIPRQDTETLVEWVLEECGVKLSQARNGCTVGQRQAPEANGGKMPQSALPNGDSRPRVLDMCTGSGCIGLSLAKLGDLDVTLADVSDAAVRTARRNRAALGLAAEICQGDLFDALPKGVRYDMIVSNPPYIASAVIDGLMEEVRSYEPRLALDGGASGLDFYRRLAWEGRPFLTPGGRLYVEIGYDQGESVPAILRAAGFEDIEVRRDLAGQTRVVRGVLTDV